VVYWAGAGCGVGADDCYVYNGLYATQGEEELEEAGEFDEGI
jgi:hypothetical protein